MIEDLVRAAGELRDPRVRGVLWRGIVLAVLTFVALIGAVGEALRWAGTTGYAWLDLATQAVTAVGGVLLAWLLFPAVVVAASSFFLERVVDGTERRYVPGLPPPRLAPLGETALAALRLLALALLLNLVALPFYFIPGANLPVWLLLNGYLIGREYFELVALRRLAPAEAAAARRDERLQVLLAGTLIAFLLTVPLVNLAAPILGAAFMTLRFHRLAPAAAAWSRAGRLPPR